MREQQVVRRTWQVEALVATDESALALEVGAECARMNGLVERIHYVRSDARDRMTLAGREGGFDLVLCDPPKFAPSKSSKLGALDWRKAIEPQGDETSPEV